MYLYLLRHAHAIEGRVDSQRPLSQKGEDVALKWAEFLPGWNLFHAEYAWTSPYKRASQTLRPIVKAMPDRLKLEEKSFLTPYDDPKLAANAIHKMKSSILIAGHNPHLSLLAGQLLGFPPDHSFLHFKKGGLLVLEKSSKGAPFLMLAYLTPASLGWL